MALRLEPPSSSSLSALAAALQGARIAVVDRNGMGQVMPSPFSRARVRSAAPRASA